MEPKSDAASIILKKLSPNEKLLWCGHPYDKTSISVSNAYRVSVGFLWCAANLFMLFKLYLKTEGMTKVICFAVFALFFSVGLYMIFSNTIQKRNLRKTAVYAITSKRIIFAKIDSMGNVKKMESIPLERAEEGNLIGGKDGIGTITFWSATENQKYRNGNWAFYNIKEIERVWDIFQNAQKSVRLGGDIERSDI